MSETETPLITFVLLAYNQEKFIREAVESALSQTYAPLEIILSDDCSTDCTFSMMKTLVSLYSGQHKVRLIRNEKNLGIGLHVQKLLSMAKGELIVMAAGDDISLSSRVLSIYKYWEYFDRPMAIASSLSVIDSDGEFIEHSRNERFDAIGNNIVNRNEMLVEHFSGISGISLIGATLCYSNQIVDFFGGFSSEINHEDSVYLGRAFLLGNVLSLEEKLVLHRITGANATARLEIRKPSVDRDGFLGDSVSHIQKSRNRSGYFLSRVKYFEQQLSDLKKAKDNGLLDDCLYEEVFFVVSNNLKSGKLNYFLSDCTFVQFITMFITMRPRRAVVRMYASAKFSYTQFLISKFIKGDA